jgi:thioester reductase-like protein
MVAARARGIPVSIYRPSLISGHTTTGDCKLDDLLPLCIQGFVAYGYAPEIHNQFIDFVPVDYVSQAVIALSLNSANLGRAFNLVHPRPWRWNELIEQIKARGYPLECLDYRAWIERLRQTSERGGIVSLLPFFERMPEELFTLPRVCFQNTTAGLAGSGIECRSPADLLDVYFHYFLKIGWIPAPR